MKSVFSYCMATLIATALILFASCSTQTRDGSATITLPARALIAHYDQNVAETSDFALKISVFYAYDAFEQEKTQTFGDLNLADYDNEPLLLPLVIDGLPLGRTVTFSMKIWSIDGDEEVPLYKSKSAVSAIIEEETAVQITLVEWNEEEQTEQSVYPSNIKLPDVEHSAEASTDDEFSKLIQDANALAGVHCITLKADITYDGTFHYNNHSPQGALIIDLNEHTLTITNDATTSVFTTETSLYIINGTIDDRRSAVATTSANLFYNKSTLYFKKVDFRNGKNQAIYQGKDNDQTIDGVTYVEDCIVMGYADTTPFYFDEGLAVISNTTFSGNGSSEQTVYNGGELILTGGTTINSGSLALTNAGTALLVGATVNTTIQNNGTLALLSAYTHGETNFVAASGANTINATGYAIENGNCATLILDKTANISGTVHIDNSNNSIQDVQSKIFVAKGTTSFKNNITIEPAAYNYSVTATTGAAGIDYALVFGITNEYNNNTPLIQVQDVTKDLINYFEIAEITGADGATISGTWDTVTYSGIAGAYSGYAIKKNN